MQSKTLVTLGAAITLGFAQPPIKGSESFRSLDITRATPSLVDATLTSSRVSGESLEKLDNVFLKNTEEFIVRSGDSPAGLALKHDLGLEEFIILNEQLKTQ